MNKTAMVIIMPAHTLVILLIFKQRIKAVFVKGHRHGCYFRFKMVKPIQGLKSHYTLETLIILEMHVDVGRGSA